MKKKYNTNKIIESYRSYKISDICRIFIEKKLHPQTIRKWIKECGLEAFEYKGDFYIYGAILKEFLKQYNNKNKQSLQDNEFKCQKCKQIGTLKDNLITEIKEQKNQNLIIYGFCNCDYRTHKFWSKHRKDELQKIFNQMQLATREDSSDGNSKTNIENVNKIEVSESLVKKTRKNKVKIDNQPTLFDFIDV
jgi:hypothetical protein